MTPILVSEMNLQICYGGIRYYPHHYAPLVSDLAKQTGALGKIRSPAVIPPEVPGLGRSWAPQYSPVQPLLQLMAVLPPQRSGPKSL